MPIKRKSCGSALCLKNNETEVDISCSDAPVDGQVLMASCPNTAAWQSLGTLATQNGTFSGTSSGTNTGDQDLTELLVSSNNLSDLASASTARTNLGLGTLATQSGTFSGTSSGTNTGDQDLSTLLVKASNLSDLTSASTARTNLGLGTIATQAASNVTISGGAITGTTIDGVNIKSYVDNAVVGLLEFKGSTDCSLNPNYPSGNKGDSYYVSVAGKIGGASGKSVEVGDVYVANADNAGGTEASVGTSWFVMEHNLVGALVASNNLSDLASASTARTNLGLGTLATQSGTFSGTSSGTNTGDQTTVVGNSGNTNALVTASGTVNVSSATAPTSGQVLMATSGTAATWQSPSSTLLVKANNLSDLASASTARTNLGLGTLATQSGTFSGTSSGTNTGDQTSVAGNSGTTNALISATTTVNVSSATAPTSGQVLMATSGTAATWQSPVTISSTDTFTNKRITKRVQNVTNSATITPNSDSDDAVDLTAIAQNFTIANPSGTPTNKQTLTIEIKDNGTARTISWGTNYVAGGCSLPSTTVAGKILTLGFIYSTANSLNKWRCIASAQEQ